RSFQSCRRIDGTLQPMAMVVQEQRKGVVRRYSGKRQRLLPRERARVTALVQHGPAPRGSADGDLIIPSKLAVEPDRSEVVIQSCEMARFSDFKFEFLPQLSAQSRDFVLPVIDPAAEQSPMPGIPDARNVIAQLHDIAAVLQHEQRCDGVSDLQRSAGG